VVRGEPGIGKTALLGYAAGTAPDFQVARTGGVESEMELPFAALQQLCGRMLGGLDQLPGPQRDALGVAFGLRAGSAPDRFLVGLAVLGLLSEEAAGRPLLCLVDDAQWLDQASAQALAFAARRLDAESVALLFATRDPAGEGVLADLPGLVLEGLPAADARALLASVLPGLLDERVRDRIIAESGGNPLAVEAVGDALPVGAERVARDAQGRRPGDAAKHGVQAEPASRHGGEPRGQRDERADHGNETADQHRGGPVPLTAAAIAGLV
jgi:hypothetical protein